MGVLDFLFPKKCVNCMKTGEYLCTNCFARMSFDVRMICVVCNRYAPYGLTHLSCRKQYTLNGVFSGVVFNSVVRKLLYAFKYRPYVSDIGSLMANLLYEGLIQQEQFITSLSVAQPILVPIPLSIQRLRKRGYNHAEILSNKLAEKFSLRTLDCLERIRETKPQFGLTRIERLANINGCFSIKKKFIGQLPQNIFLVDDILTSGSTLAEAARVLKQAGVKMVWGLTFAREQNR